MSIEVRNLSFNYGQRTILDAVNLQIKLKETVSILGPNGAGKTTLLNIITGLLPPASGDVLYAGKPYARMGYRELALLIGYVPQVLTPAFDYSVLEYVVTGCAPRIGTFARPGQEHYDKALAALEKMGITHLAEQSYRQISGGERQQVSIARVIAQAPQYILMDEPTSHLDYGNQIHVLKIIRRLAEEGFGVVLTTHNPDHVLLLGGKVAVLNRQGRLLYGSCEEMIQEQFLSELYDTQLCVTNPDQLSRCVCFAPRL